MDEFAITFQAEIPQFLTSDKDSIKTISILFAGAIRALEEASQLERFSNRSQNFFFHSFSAKVALSSDKQKQIISDFKQKLYFQMINTYCSNLQGVDENSFKEKVEELQALFPERSKNTIEADLTKLLAKNLYDLELEANLDPNSIKQIHENHRELLEKDKKELEKDLTKLSKKAYTDSQCKKLREKIDEIDDILDNLQQRLAEEVGLQLKFLTSIRHNHSTIHRATQCP